MPYRFQTDLPDYADFASGRVFYSLPGVPAFPVRLAGEIFQRSRELLATNGIPPPYTIYDPCCGSAYLLGTVAFLHWKEIHRIIASDIDWRALEIARKNLSLLTIAGIDERMEELAGMLDAYGKESHSLALQSARTLRQRMEKLSATHPIEWTAFQADATSGQAVYQALGEEKIDLVLTDIPYGLVSSWQSSVTSSAPPANPAWAMLESLRLVVRPGGLVVIVSNKGQKIAHEAYRRVERFRLGKRQVVIFKFE